MRRSLVSLVGFCVAGCHGDALDLGRNEAPRYATPETLAAEERAPAGTPTEMATLQYGARAIAVDDTRVYWSTSRMPSYRPDLVAEGCAVRSCVKTDCAGTLITYASGCLERSMPSDRLLVNRTHVFWSTWGLPSQVYGCPIEGCDGSPASIAKTGVPGFTVDDTHIYWKSPDATLLQCPLRDCNEAPTIVAFLDSQPHAGSSDPVVDDTHIYWVTDAPSVSHSILTTLKGGMSPIRTFAGGLRAPKGVAVAARNVYWIENDLAGKVVSCPLTGCIGGDPVVLASQQVWPTSLVIHGDQAFWFTHRYAPPDDVDQRDLDTIRQCPVRGCGSDSDLLSEQPIGMGAIAVDATHVYWTSTRYPTYGGDALDGYVKRIRRRP